MENFEVVVGIDFGSSGMGYAFSYNDIKNIELGKISDSGVEIKIPTEIILDDYNKILVYGENCKNFITQKGFNIGHYFKRIKMRLYNGASKIKADNSGKELEIQLVISKILEAIKKEAIKTIRNNRPNIKEEKIKWILTVPAIFDERCKYIMAKAAKISGLINKDTPIQNFFALEPEAASLYCLQDKSLDSNFMKKGRQYIVCDLGGGTGDIVTHIIGTNNHISEIAPPNGGSFGSNEIDKAIYERVIFGIFGIKDFEGLSRLVDSKEDPSEFDKNSLYSEWTELEKQIKTLKETLKEDLINETFPIKCSVFEDFYTIEDLETFVEDYNTENPNWKIKIKNKKKWMLDFPYKIVYDLVKEQSIKISIDIKKIIRKVKNIKDIIFVGGYCSSDIIVNSIKERLPEIKCFYKPSNPGLAVIKGAVIFGINPFVIEVRKAKYTIGKATDMPWDERLHSKKGKKVFYPSDRSWRCEDCFEKFTEINKDICINDEITQNYLMGNERYAKLIFYKSLKPNPLFVFEEGVEEIGSCTLDLEEDYPIEKREIVVTMKIGGTFFDIKAFHIESGKQVKARISME